MDEWSSLRNLESRLKEDWSAIWDSKQRADKTCTQLASVVSEIVDQSVSIVVTGSLGRGEATLGSDADWMFLIDGLSDPHHALLHNKAARDIQAVIGRDVGSTRTFGEMVPAHELIHYIAGGSDTNRNLTRRMLLLAESRALSNGETRARVIRNILNRYVLYDRPVPSRDGTRHNIPHFLLNDVVRYWRTIASDYASKKWEQEGEKWAIRNIKLRFSRKLLFTWGLLAAFSAQIFPSEDLLGVEDDEEFFMILAEQIRLKTDIAPLELLAQAVEQNCTDETARSIFTSYNLFLERLGDPVVREELEKVAFEQANENEAFVELRNISSDFRNGMETLFFEEHPQLPALIREYGVF